MCEHATSTIWCAQTLSSRTRCIGAALNLALYAHRVTIKQSVSEKRSNLWGRGAREASERATLRSVTSFIASRLQNFPARARLPRPDREIINGARAVAIKISSQQSTC